MPEPFLTLKAQAFGHRETKQPSSWMWMYILAV